MARRGVMKKIREDGWSRQEKGGGEPAGQPASQPLRGEGERRRMGRTRGDAVGLRVIVAIVMAIVVGVVAPTAQTLPMIMIRWLIVIIRLILATILVIISR